MKFRAMLAALAIIAPLAQAEDGKLDVYGELVIGACGLDPNSQRLEVGLGLVSTQRFRQIGDRSQPIPFDIRLIECSISTQTTVAVRFTGPRDRENPSLMAITGNAVGIGIRLQSPNGTDITLGEYSPLTGLTNGTNNLRFNAMYESTRAASASGQAGGVQPGSANGLAQFDLRYM
ncbi:fimbrial protein [Chromobacterium amazonense]|uniref:Fimbrial protein n=1 Tax=Chromobacterium amazonense TaxID=1382803 RepID=A0ABU8V6V4_9NEIS|nr:fimbrial protein [Chromobacterium amazonense]MDQ4541100.1 fimbrial protein [Chromobacterium amazonense]